MTALGDESDREYYLSAQQLYVGVFVLLDLPWFKHSFTLNKFKVSTEEQVRELRALQLPRYKYDPSRSDPAPDIGASAAADISPPPVEPPVAASAPPVDPVLALQLKRKEMMVQRRESVERIERAFTKATTVVKNMNKNIFSRPKETLEDLSGLASDMVEAFLQSPEATLHVMGEKAGGEDVYNHSLNVAILSMMLAKEMGLSPEAAGETCMGALLHDIGLTEIPDRVAKKSPSEASLAERNLRATHVQLGVAIGKRIGLSPLVLGVLAQHHEFIDGSGYPNGLKLTAISEGARLVSLINYYDNLCNPTDASKALLPHEALSYMFAQCRPKFESRALQLLIRSLGVHPPGSIVQLSNEKFAIVTSVNPQKPLRPWILVYDETTPKEDAMMVNLEVETDLQILKSIRPSLLPPKVAAYLNPRKRVTYFFDGSSTASGESEA
jgi:putative nucleotidyltransferase with HDIG domain